MSIAVNARRVSGIAIFDLSGRLIAGAAGDTLRETLRQAYDQGDRAIVLNCDGLTYVDSCGMGELVAAYSSIVRRGGVLRLLSPTVQLRRLLALTRLDSLFDIHDEETLALA